MLPSTVHPPGRPPGWLEELGDAVASRQCREKYGVDTIKRQLAQAAGTTGVA